MEGVVFTAILRLLACLFQLLEIGVKNSYPHLRNIKYGSSSFQMVGRCKISEIKTELQEIISKLIIPLYIYSLYTVCVETSISEKWNADLEAWAELN